MHKVWVSTILGLAILGGALGQKGQDLEDQRWPDPDFSKVDWASIEAEIQVRRPGQDPAQLSFLARRNLQHLFFNCLNRTRFLALPSPRIVAERVSVLLRLNRELGHSIGNGKVFLDPGGASPRIDKQRELIREIEETTKQLRRRFGEFFVEPRESTFSFSILIPNEKFQFPKFLHQAEKINVRLTQEINSYFLADSPGAVQLGEYPTATIGVLTESLLILCRRTRQVLR